MSDPIALFTSWLHEAQRHKGIIEPTAACLATADMSGQPSARIVLVKHTDAQGFIFYTNLESRKSRELRQNPKAALCFYWMPLRKQVRIEGSIEPVTEAEADVYFASRPRESQIGAWSSKQSQPLSGRDELLHAVEQNTEKFEGGDIPRPEFWSGWRIVPQSIEFWQQGEFRLHDREVYVRKNTGWDVGRLYP